MKIDPRMIAQLASLQMKSIIEPTSSDSLPQFAPLLENMLQTLKDDSISEDGFPLTRINKQLPASFKGDFTRLSSIAYHPDTFAETIEAASAKYGVSEDLIHRIIKVESNYNPNATSSADAKGLMQLMDRTAAQLGVTDAYNPEQNIDGGVRYLKDLLHQYGQSERVAVAAYNAGPGTMTRLDIHTEADLQAKYQLLPKETQNYVMKVMKD